MSDFTEFTPRSGIAWQGGDVPTVGVVQYPEDRNKVVFFYLRPTDDPVKSNETGRPWKKNVVFVRVAPPGERLNIVDRPATKVDMQRWPVQYAQFRDNQQQMPEGTPIDLLYPTNPAIGETLKANNVFTIEQCAELSGNAIESVGMGTQAWVNAAQKYLEAAKRGVKASQLQRELDERDRQIRVLQRQVEDLTAAVARTEERSKSSALMAAQELIASQMGRPQHMPGLAFDPQTAQINANSPTKVRADAVRNSINRDRPRLSRDRPRLSR